MKIFLCPAYPGCSGYFALLAFLVVYAATLAFVIVPEHVTSAAEVSWPWHFK
jgi:hypothetical protein